MTQSRLLAALLFGRSEIADTQERDHFWTILSYYNSLKDVGKMANRINSELHPEQVQLFQRMLKRMLKGRAWPPRYRELTSRIQSTRVKENLDALAFGIGNTENKNRPLDLALATNMISVGLDIGRLGVMVINGMPRNIAEYIQSSSRVARKNEGMVFTLLNPDNSRDLSIFEHFIPFHQTYYKQVEPLSITPFTDNTFDMLLFTMLVAFYRNRMNQYQNEKAAEMDTQILTNEFLAAIRDHPFLKDIQRKVLQGKIETILKKWEDRINNTEGLRFRTNVLERTLLRTAQNKQNEDDLIAMQSMRNVEPICRVQINQY
jgi:superfamily II DNA/RNA helicase